MHEKWIWRIWMPYGMHCAIGPGVFFCRPLHLSVSVSVHRAIAYRQSYQPNRITLLTLSEVVMSKWVVVWNSDSYDVVWRQKIIFILEIALKLSCCWKEIRPVVDSLILNANRDFSTIRDAMRILSISRTQLSYLRMKGLLATKRLGRKVYITKEPESGEALPTCTYSWTITNSTITSASSGTNEYPGQTISKFPSSFDLLHLSLL